MKKNLRLVIVGGVAGGASAAARARRLSEFSEITVLEKGPYVSFANCGLPYHLSGTIAERDRLLVQTPESLKARFNIDVRINTEAISIDRTQKKVKVRNLITNREEALEYDRIILSPGAEALKPKIPGIENSRVHFFQTLTEMDLVIERLEAGAQKAIVVGGGFIGLEVAENLAQRGLKVSLIEGAPQVFAPFDSEMAEVLHQELRKNEIDLHLNAKLERIEENSEKVLASIHSQKEPLEADFIVAALGVRPRTQLAREANLKIGESGAIWTNEFMQTSDPDIYAVGDAIETNYRILENRSWIALAGPANRQGRIAAENALGARKTYKGNLGTSVCQVFSKTAAAVGLNSRTLRQKGISFESTTIHPSHHASYYPGAESMTMKMLFSKPKGKIYGAQIVGGQGVDKRIDVLATAIQAGLSVFDLQDLELAYAPPYGAAKDPVNMMGFVASNILENLHKPISALELKAMLSDKELFLIDVRTPAEFERGTISGAKLMPLDELRNHISSIPKNKKVVIFCQAGLRGYIAQRILSENGIESLNLEGGFKTWCLNV